MDVDVWDEDGRPLRGEKGELVCRTAFPSCPVGFWNFATVITTLRWRNWLSRTGGSAAR